MSRETEYENWIALFEQTYTALRKQVTCAVNSALVVRNWLFGCYIVEFEQLGFERAEYGKGVLLELSCALTGRLGKGFSVDTLELMRRFYRSYSNPGLLGSNTETVSRISESISVTVSREGAVS